MNDFQEKIVIGGGGAIIWNKRFPKIFKKLRKIKYHKSDAIYDAFIFLPIVNDIFLKIFSNYKLIMKQNLKKKKFFLTSKKHWYLL